MFRARSVAAVATIALATSAIAGVVLDGSVGPAGAVPGPHHAIDANVGLLAGSNLFHSFSSFALSTGESATFSGPAGVANILARVTGGQSSNIDGTLRSNIAGANLYLINPRGILFGPHARLELTGSFFATTADRIMLADGSAFHASDPASSSFTTAEPVAFGFLGGNGHLEVNGSVLAVTERKTISLAGRELRIAQAELLAKAGRIDMAATDGQPTTLPIDGSGDTPLGRISTEGAMLDVGGNAAAAAGSVLIRGGQILASGSLVIADHATAAKAGTLRLEAQDLVLRNTQIVADNAGSGNGAGIVLRARQLDVTGGSLVNTSNSGTGIGGDIEAEASGSLSLSGDSRLSTTALAGSGGAVTLTAAELAVLDGSRAGSVAAAAGSGGRVRISAQRVSVAGKGAAGEHPLIGTRAVSTESSAASGNIEIDADTIELRDSGRIESSQSPLALGRGSDMTIRARQVLITDSPGGDFDASSIVNENHGAGISGDVRIQAETVRVLRGGRIEGRVHGSGPGGSIVLRTGQLVIGESLDGPTGQSNIANVTEGTGRAGGIDIESRTIDVSDGGLIVSASLLEAPGAGDAGNVRLTAEQLSLRATRNRDLVTGVLTQTIGPGAAGRIDVQASAISVLDGAKIASDTIGFFDGSAGDISLRAGSVRISAAGASTSSNLGPTRSRISSSSFSAGRAANIAVTADRVDVTDGGIIESVSAWPFNDAGAPGTVTIDAGTLGIGGRSPSGDASHVSVSSLRSPAGGGIAINARELTVIDDGSIDAVTLSPLTEAIGGTIDIRAGSLLIREADVSASTYGSGRGGEVKIRALRAAIDAGGVVRTESFGLFGDGRGGAGDIAVHADELAANRGLIFASTAGPGPGGNVSLSGNTLTLSDGARILAESTGSGRAGIIDLSFAYGLTLAGSRISSRAITADGGDISIRAGNRVYLRDSVVSTAVGTGLGAGGNIRIDPIFVILDNSVIRADAFGGPGGNISIAAEYFLSSPRSVLDASSQLGVSGTVSIAAPNMDLSAALAALPADFFDASQLLRASCAARAIHGSSSLVSTGRGGMESAPDGFGHSRYFGDPQQPYEAESVGSPGNGVASPIRSNGERQAGILFSYCNR